MLNLSNERKDWGEMERNRIISIVIIKKNHNSLEINFIIIKTFSYS